MKTLKIILVFSLLFNLLGLAGFFYVSKKLGGFGYVSGLLFGNEASKTYSKRVKSLNETDNKGKVVFLGDSLTAGGDWAILLNRKDVVNHGVPGDTTNGVIKRIDNLASDKPSKVFIMIGINDLAGGKSLEKVYDNYQKIIDSIKKISPNTMIYVQETLPINQKSTVSVSNDDVAKLNNLLKDIDKVTLISMSEMTNNGQLKDELSVDGLHLNDRGYEEWKNIVIPYINQ